MPVSVPPLVYQELIQSADAGYLNRMKQRPIDRLALPLLSWADGLKKVVDMSQGIIRVGMTVSDEGENQGWDRSDGVTFAENMPSKQAEFSVYNEHRGLVMWATDLMNAGYEVDFNSTSKTLASPLSASEKTRLRDYIGTKVSNFRDAAKVSCDKNLHLDGTQDLKRTPGLEAALPLNRLGSYGGILGTDPKWQHYIATGLTSSLGGTLEEGMNTAFWNVRTKRRDSESGKIRLICGRGFADRYRRYGRLNNMQINVDSGQVKTLDVNIADSGLRYMGHALEINPTFALLDAAYAPANPWDLRCYIVTEESFCWGMFNKTDWSMSVPAPTASTRDLKLSLDWRMSFFCKNRNVNAVITAAA